MPIVSLVVEFHPAESHPLNARQKKIRADEILTKLRTHFNVTVADLSRVGAGDPIALGFASVGRTRREARDVLDRVADAVSSHPRVQLVRVAFDDL